jgi:hypothetical protein
MQMAGPLYIYQNRGTVGGSGSDADTGPRSVLFVIEKKIRTNASRPKIIPAAQYRPDGSSKPPTWC